MTILLAEQNHNLKITTMVVMLASLVELELWVLARMKHLVTSPRIIQCLPRDLLVTTGLGQTLEAKAMGLRSLLSLAHLQVRKDIKIPIKPLISTPV
jgi:hypothetical protein